MDEKKILSLHSEAKKIRESYGRWKRMTGNPSADKYEFGFKDDDRFDSAGPHKVRLITKIGYFGNSGCSTVLDVANREQFWKLFDEYCNAHIQDILGYIADGFDKMVEDNIVVLSREKDRIASVIAQATPVKINPKYKDVKFPEIGKEYKVYDNGVQSDSRTYHVRPYQITNLSASPIYTVLAREIVADKDFYMLPDELTGAEMDTVPIVYASVIEPYMPNTVAFVVDKDGGWFGIGSEYDGQLILEDDGHEA